MVSFAFLSACDPDPDPNPAEEAGIPVGVSCAQPYSGLISWWSGDGNANDSASANHGLEINGANYALGGVGETFSFDGIDDYLTIPDTTNLNPTSAVSITSWVKLSNNNKYQIILSKFYANYLNGAGDDSYLLGINPTGGIYWVVETLTGATLNDNQTNSSPVSIFNNKFHHVVGTYDGANMKIYFDGQLVQTLAASGDIQGSPATPVLIGGGSNLNANDWFTNGQLDEVTLYNVALSESQISDLYAAGDKGVCKS